MIRNARPVNVIMAAIVFGFSSIQIAQAQVLPDTLKSISIPNKVETPIGTLEFFDGVPKNATVATVYDNLDRMRGTEVFLDNVGAVSMYSVRAYWPGQCRGGRGKQDCPL